MGTKDLYYIRVSGIQPDCTDDDIAAHFQGARCGSGTVQKVTANAIDDDANSTAVIVGIEGLDAKACELLYYNSDTFSFF